jgi:hypothetical protein
VDRPKLTWIARSGGEVRELDSEHAARRYRDAGWQVHSYIRARDYRCLESSIIHAIRDWRAWGYGSALMELYRALTASKGEH